MVVNGAPGEKELLGDLGVAMAGQHQGEHLALARGQPGLRSSPRRLPGAASDPRANPEPAQPALRCKLRGGQGSQLLEGLERLSQSLLVGRPRAARATPRGHLARLRPLGLPPRPPVPRRAPAPAGRRLPPRRGLEPREPPPEEQTGPPRRCPPRARAAASVALVARRHAGALLEPGDLRPCRREVDVDSDLLGGTPTASASSSAAPAPWVAAACSDEREHDERLVVRPR